MATAYLGLGSNLGNRLAFLRGGRDRLASHPAVSLRRSSPLYETAAEGGPPDSPPFYNAVIEIDTTLPPRELLHACLAVEDEFGRVRPAPLPWAPRTLDIDLLLYAEQVLTEPDLQLPHPHLHRRAFVLAPLRDLAPRLMVPGQAASVAELAARLPAATLPPLRATW